MTTEAIPSLLSLCSRSVTDALPSLQVATYLNKEPFISIPGGINIRSLASPTLPSGRIFRSGTLAQIPAPMLPQLLTTYNIRTIYDLRRADERKTAPSPIIDGVETVWIPSTIDGTIYWPDQNGVPRKKETPTAVPTAAFADGDGINAWTSTYRNILDTHGHIFKAILEKIRDGVEGAVLFHCTAGRDRTGVLAALLLALCHTPRAIIAREHLLTRIGIEPYRDYLFQHFFGMSVQNAAGLGTEGALAKPGVLEMCETREASILGFLDWMDETWGDAGDHGDAYPGVHGWFVKELGFEESDRETIEARLGVERV
ncbi:MAG: hypothetical protein Q9204_008972 [Flavoplaca sp. TL-2023a]